MLLGFAFLMFFAGLANIYFGTNENWVKSYRDGWCKEVGA
jgi:hypothetical protein